MSCKTSRFNSNAGLHMETWSGLAKQNGAPTLICSIDDQTDARHFVEIKNIKTYSRTIYVKGIVSTTHNNAKFERVPPCKEREWEASQMLYSNAGTDTMTIGLVQIVKKSKGQETIKVQVEYEDVWNPGKVRRADLSSNELVFKVDLI